jgi:ribosomal protein S27E
MIAETSTGIKTADGSKFYHTNCITTLKCDNCGATMGYLAGGGLEGKFLKAYCPACSKTF